VQLDLDLLAQIAQAVEIPLVLHGVSGLPDAEVRSAIALGVAKLNVNTELRRAFRDGLMASAAAPPAGDGIASLLETATQATQTAAQEKLRAFTATRAAGGAGPSAGALKSSAGAVGPAAGAAGSRASSMGPAAGAANSAADGGR
jgi:hypothetical protein